MRKPLGRQLWAFNLIFLVVQQNSQMIVVLAGGFKDFLFSPRKLGKISNLTNIFQVGWKHQPVVLGTLTIWGRCLLWFISVLGKITYSWHIFRWLDFPRSIPVGYRQAELVPQSLRQPLLATQPVWMDCKIACNEQNFWCRFCWLWPASQPNTPPIKLPQGQK